MWSPTAATLIYGERDAVLIDPLMTAAEGEDLAGWIAASGKNLTTVFVTHGHGDHFFGATPVLERFPDAKMVATPAVVQGMKKQLTPAWLDGFWRVSMRSKHCGHRLSSPAIGRPMPPTIRATSMRPAATCAPSRPQPRRRLLCWTCTTP